MQRFALIGAGFIGTVHAANLAVNPDVDFCFVYDVDTNRAAVIADTFGAAVAGSLDEIFDAGAIDAVFIASSTDTHAGHLRRAADAGVAARCEKPLHTSPRGGHSSGLRQGTLTIDGRFNRRFDRDYAELKRIVDSGEIGDVELIQLSSRGPAMPPLEYIAVSGGQMRDQAVHFFDLARWISGFDPVEVFATGSTLAEPRLAAYGDVDTSAVTLRLASGALVQIDCTRRIGYGYDERIEVLGSTGMAEARRHRNGNVSRYAPARSRTTGSTRMVRASQTDVCRSTRRLRQCSRGRHPHQSLP